MGGTINGVVYNMSNFYIFYAIGPEKISLDKKKVLTDTGFHEKLSSAELSSIVGYSL